MVNINGDYTRLVLFILLALLFLISPFYSQPNIGGVGLALTYNIPVWTVASWVMAIGIIFSLRGRQFIYPRLWTYLIAFPLIVVISSLLAGVNLPILWFFRQLYLLGGLFFLFALFQFQIRQLTIDRILFVIVIAIGLHALLGTMQIVTPDHLAAYFPPNDDVVPRGMFQQINVQASFLATGLVISLYLISRPSFRLSSFFVKTVLVIAFTLAVYIIIASGSRVGLLSILISIPLVVWSRFQQLRPRKVMLTILLIASCGSLIVGQSGLHKTLDKTVQLSEKSYSTARIAMYTIGLELVAKEPIHGYGINGFLAAWNPQASDFVARHPETVLPTSVNHPHNEILFWMIEGGLSALLGIIVFSVGISLALYHCGFQRGGAYVAMLLPITLHTQVELPFYISSVHWFLWLFIIFLVLRHQKKEVAVNLSQAATKLIYIVAPSFAIGITLFMINTARAQDDVYDFLYNKNVKPPYLEIAMNNLYFRPLAEQVAMRSMLYASIENNDREKVTLFERWAIGYVSYSPELKMYEDLISASMYLRPEGQGCDAISAGLAMYAHNKPLQKAYLQCK